MSDGPGTRLYTIWKGMKRRCMSPSSADYPGYGGRGIIVCASWHSFVPFLDWALLNGYQQDRQIDRIDADGPYSPENCRWVSALLNNARRELDRDGAYVSDLSGRLNDDIAASTRPQGRAVKLYDGAGLYLIISPKGCRSWRLKFMIDRREKSLTLGRYPVIGIAEARELAAVARRRVRRGIDPCVLKAETTQRRLRRRNARGMRRATSGYGAEQSSAGPQES